jgi:enoyl-[acyl-carrier protein] reductase II
LLLGRARAKRGMFEGDLIEGELEIGQIAGLIHEIKASCSYRSGNDNRF